MRVHVKGIVLLICIVRKSGVVSSLRLSRAIEILVFSCQQSYNNEVHRNYCMRSYVSTIAYNVFLSNFCFCCLEHFFSPTDSCFSRWKLTNLNNFPNSVDISLSRLWQKRSCTRQMQFFHECLPGRYAVYNHRLQSADVSCPNRARTHRSDYQNRVCNHPKHGRNQQSHLASSETPSNLHRLISDHRTPQIRPNHQDWFCTLHWSCHRTCKLQRSSCKLKTKWRSNDYYALHSWGMPSIIFFEKMVLWMTDKIRISISVTFCEGFWRYFSYWQSGSPLLICSRN